MIIVQDKVVTTTNRKGLSVPVDVNLEQDILKAMEYSHGVLDGEDMGDYVMLFDYLVNDRAYSDRYKDLEFVIKDKGLKTVKLVLTAWNTSQKRALYKSLKRDNAEGIVFKKINGLYKPGRPNSGGDQLKFKFCATATCMVDEINPTKRSVSLAIFDKDGAKINIGNVTVYPNQDIPKPGDIVEVKYLYAYKEGSLFQPVYLGQRDDVQPDNISRLKFKPEITEEA
jgi:bifunctional non-homologous end joining protein LigD